MTELIIKVDDDFLEQAHLRGMESQYMLIRCRDCKECEPNWEGWHCKLLNKTVYSIDFCSWAERRTE